MDLFHAEDTETAEGFPEIIEFSAPSALSARNKIPLTAYLWPNGITLIWLAGMGGMITLFLWQILRCRRWVAMAKPVTNERVLNLFADCRRRIRVGTWLVVAESTAVRTPFLIGAIRPKLLLPQRMVERASRSQLRSVFLHELAHLKRRDIWTGWLMAVLLIVHWFNPMLWIAIRRMNGDREEACDVMAMNQLNRKQQGGYAHALLDVAQQFASPTQAPGLVGISETGKFLKRRITMLKQIGTWKLRWKLLALGLVLLIAVVTLTDAKPKPQNDVNAQSVDEAAATDAADADVSALQQELNQLKLNLDYALAALQAKELELERTKEMMQDLQNPPTLVSPGQFAIPLREPLEPPQPVPPNREFRAYQLKNRSIEQADEILRKEMPTLSIISNSERKTLVVSASREEHEAVRELLQKAEMERDYIPNLRISLTSRSPFVQGDEQTCQLRLSNTGDKDMADLKLIIISNGIEKANTLIETLKAHEERELDVVVDSKEVNSNTLELEVQVADADGRTCSLKKIIELLQPIELSNIVGDHAVVNPANLPVQVPVPHDPVPQMVQQVQKTKKSVMVYRLLYRSPEQAEDLIRNMFPMLSIQTERSTNSVIVTCSREEKEIVREILQKADVPAVAEPVPPQPPDPFAGKYLIEGHDDEAGKRSGLELTYLGNNRSPQRLLSDNMRWTNDATGTYRIVQYAGGLPGDGYDESQGRMIGTATLDGNKLSIDWEVVHDGKRYLPLHKEVITGDNPDTITGKFVRDGDTTLLMLLLPDTRPGLTDVPGVRFVSTVAVKVGE
jgi:beta-lactamase regulating signal transducer with metallopeptidase domain